MSDVAAFMEPIFKILFWFAVIGMVSLFGGCVTVLYWGIFR
jgi:hypothetical protein